ncbi:MAG: ATP-binding cassette domain-containing protein [Fibrella sp.]|nr:ATP-binding cassette domain-containing protein [Armatimonadota bacterium]
MISLSQVAVHYRSGAKGIGAVVALRDVSLQVPDGDFLFLVGPTGAGKSTLLKLLYRDVAPTSGTVTVAGLNLSAMNPYVVHAFRRWMVIVLQVYGLRPDRTVWENVAFACEVLEQNRREYRKRIPEVLDLVNMAHRCDAFPHQLSGGEQQRVAIARALVNHPALLIADEPTGNLDPETASGVMDVLLEANRRGATVVIATHDATSVNRLRRRVIAVERGTIARDDGEGAYAYAS